MSESQQERKPLDVYSKKIFTSKAPRPIGAYSQARLHKGVLYVSGQVPINPLTSTYSPAPIAREATLVFEHLGAILEEAGMTPDHVLKVNIYLTRIQDFAQANEVYARFFVRHTPARETVEVSALPLGVKIEVSCLAAL